jgi:hypothetical protein
MAKFYRRLFFWIFFLLFFITTPLAIYYSQGYRFDKYKKIFIHSGSITIKSTPSSVNIYLNGKLQPSRTLDIINNSITLNGIRPGNYNLRVAAEGYGTWEKNIEVHSGVSTEFWNVFLPPLNYAPKELAATDAQRYFPSPFGKKIAYMKKNGDQLEIWSLDIKSDKSVLLFSQKGLDFPDDPLENAEWNFKEKLLAFPVIKNGQKDFLILDSENSQNPMLLSEATGFSPLDRARWSPSDQKIVYFLAKSEKESLHRIDIDTKIQETILENIKAYDMSSSSIFFLKDNDIIYKTNLDGGNENQITFASIPLSEGSGRLRLIAYDNDRQAIISANNEFFIHNNSDSDTIKKIADDILGVQFSDDGKKILYWKNNEIFVFYLRKWEVQPRREENEIEQIVRFSAPVRNIFWYRDYAHIFFSTQGKMKVIELDSRDHRNIFDILSYNSENFLSSYDSSNGIYYFLDQVGEKRKLFFINIPEQTSFFGG